MPQNKVDQEQQEQSSEPLEESQKVSFNSIVKVEYVDKYIRDMASESSESENSPLPELM